MADRAVPAAGRGGHRWLGRARAAGAGCRDCLLTGWNDPPATQAASHCDSLEYCVIETTKPPTRPTLSTRCTPSTSSSAPVRLNVTATTARPEADDIMSADFVPDVECGGSRRDHLSDPDTCWRCRQTFVSRQHGDNTYDAATPDPQQIAAGSGATRSASSRPRPQGQPSVSPSGHEPVDDLPVLAIEYCASCR